MLGCAVDAMASRARPPSFTNTGKGVCALRRNAVEERGPFFVLVGLTRSRHNLDSAGIKEFF